MTFLAAGLVALTHPGVASATSPPAPSVGAGLVIAVSPQPGQWGHCVLTAAGHDSTGTRLALTAGHCARLGSNVKTADRSTDLGTVIARGTFPGEGVFVTNVLDYALIRLRPGVRIGPVPGSPIVATRIGIPRTGEIACKYGQGVLFPGERCGVIGRITPVEFDAFAWSIFGDSGGPVYTTPHTVIGIVSRPAAVPFASSSIMTRVDAAVADARKRGVLRGAFTPQA
ncbi:hypothetical protein ABLE94_00675 [Gordonia sp. VNK1]|uniref:hypothetical protein n=1 Tax=Gordonia oleivorans TaxID=3156618 RepID=UPI0032B32EEF